MEGATPVGKAEAGASGDLTAEEEDDLPASCLDVSSELFDPLLALYSPRTPLPFPDVRCFNNVAEYESFLRGGGRGRGRARAPGARKASSRKGRKPAPDPERVERLKKLMLPVEEGTQPVRPRRNRRPPKNVLTRMPLHEGSPLGELYRCVQDRLKVKVHIRTFKGLRGVCSGFIVAFDKCWNMAMVDVDETYRKPVLGKAYYSEPQLTLTRLFDQLKLQESGLQSSPETRSTVSKRLARPTPRTRAQHGDCTDRALPSKDPRLRAQQPGKNITIEDQTKKGVSGDKPRQRTKHPKEKIDYQQVYTRHMNQVFIRGESILLVHVPE
ncbi:U7 snRNA-associated Sm-like protein LSm11 [Pseudophryne corroboree]|uniref:U7 snRNA-associated Sm-like protein LSm11 n=1 Tax=Pseudophryne corroboree TaxID=495146 RepID=UPI003081EE4E